MEICPPEYLVCHAISRKMIFLIFGQGELIFSIYLILPAILGPVVHSASNRNEYQKEKECFYGV
jgi:hypothetical protein